MKSTFFFSFFKYLSKNKIYAFVSVFGFAFSLMFVLMLGIYIKKEFSYDKFHEKGDRLYRVSNEGPWAGNAPPTGQFLMNNFPEIEQYSRLYQTKTFVEKKGQSDKLRIDLLLADSAFFNMFSFKLISGNPNSVLSGLRPIVLTKSFALKLFDKIPELGEQINVEDHVFTLKGIMEDMPENTHIAKVDAVVDFPSLAELWGATDFLDNYNNNSFGLYLLAKPNTDIQSKTGQMQAMLKKVNWMYEQGRVKEFKLEPIADAYFSSVMGVGIKQNSRSQLNILMVIALVILLLSAINYVNLTVAQAGYRGKEVAVKKLMGGRRTRFVIQFISESALMCFISLILAVVMSIFAEPVFNKLLNTKLSLTSAFTPIVITVVLLSIFVIGIVAGLIPALKISAFNPIEIVKGKFRYSEKKIYSRLMVGLQYTVIIALVICVFTINKQTRFMKDYPLGFNQSNIISMGTLSRKDMNAFKNRLKSIAGVQEVSIVAGSPIDGGNNNSFTYKDKSLSFQTFQIDSAFFRMFEINVTPTGMSGNNSVMFNKQGVKALELGDNPTTVKIWDSEMQVVGVVDDYHFRNLKQAVGPAMFFWQTENTSSWWSTLVKIAPQNQQNTIKQIGKVYSEFSQGVPFEFEFVDQTIQSWYENEMRLSKIILIFTVLAIVISVMGLFAMTIYYVQQKTKEIGVRKVNGATIGEVLALLNKDFIKWILISFVIATPIAYYAMNRWLQSFAYKTALSWWIFALAGIIALAIALLTVSWQSWRAASRNPVEALRYE